MRIQRKESRRDGLGGDRQDRGALGASQTKEQVLAEKEGRISRQSRDERGVSEKLLLHSSLSEAQPCELALLQGSEGRKGRG